jgi:Raf kinase inhibitor-like YbhB/YbcL family protein
MRTLVPILPISSLVIAFAHLGPSPVRAESPGVRKEAVMSFQLISAAFLPHGAIPKRHTCDGEDRSPQLAWHSAPEGTKSYALVVDDPDAPDPAAPKVDWVHWVIYDVPAETRALAQGAAKSLPAGTLEGLNDWKQTGWRGPCPPVGRHRYFFRLYALDTTLSDLKKPARAALEKAIEGHVLARAELVGRYQHP